MMPGGVFVQNVLHHDPFVSVVMISSIVIIYPLRDMRRLLCSFCNVMMLQGGVVSPNLEGQFAVLYLTFHLRHVQLG